MLHVCESFAHIKDARTKQVYKVAMKKIDFSRDHFTRKRKYLSEHSLLAFLDISNRVRIIVEVAC